MAAATFEFFPAAAGAEVISAGRAGAGGLRVACQCPRHDIGGGALLTQLVGHEAHVWIDVVEEFLIARTEIVQSGFAIRRLQEAMLGAFAIAGKAYLALLAELRQRIVFVLAKFYLLRRGRHRPECRFHNVAKTVLRIHKMIAGIKVPVMFDGHGRATGLAEDAEARLHAGPHLERNIE